MSVPEWVQDAIFYQIFPDRFYNGDPANKPVNAQPWGSLPNNYGFQGGDLPGIQKKFDYLLDLGINAIYLNPIFHATSNHRYNTSDYYKIDPKLGKMDDFHALVDQAHQNNVKIILDGVFNHCGRGFFAFNDILENQEYSPFRDWFHIKHFPVDAYREGEAIDYMGWWGMKSLPKFNTNNPYVRKYLFDVSKYWIEQGADGWRLDVPNEINDDSFWAEFRQTVKSTNPDAYIVGEIWDEDLRWVGEEHFDGLINYPLVEALTSLLVTKTVDVTQFASKVEGMLTYYPKENAYAMFNCVSSHDIERILTRMGNHIEKTELVYLFQFAFPGAPSIYYGDEIGLTGSKDPGCRGAFPWNENYWNLDTYNLLKKLVNVRKQHPALRRGDFFSIIHKNKVDWYAFIRKTTDDLVLTIMNLSDKEQSIEISADDIGCKDGKIFYDLIDPSIPCVVADGKLSILLPAWGGKWLA